MKLKLIAASILGLSLSTAAWAVEPFTIQDIRIEGLQRTEPATVFSYLPVKVGDRFTDQQAQAMIKDLYATGFFDDVQVETMGNQVLLTVVERPVITDLRVSGGKAIKNDLIRTNLQNFGLATSQGFDEAILAQAVDGLKREYANRGKYDTKITPKVTRLDRNRVDIELVIDEGETTTIENINFEGNKAYSDRTLRNQISHTEGGLFTWFRKTNRFSQDKMPADLESLSEFYQNRGYFDFKVTDAQVLPNPDDKTELNMTISVDEGRQYRFGTVDIAGDLADVPAEEINALNKIKSGKRYEREQIMNLVRNVQSTMGNHGYAYTAVEVQPRPNAAEGIVDFTLMVQPGRKISVNQINISGNNKTRDEVVRRELRQMENATYDQSKINRSRERVQLLGYFDNVKVDAVPVQNSPDQVNLDMTMKERSTGSVDVALGYVQNDGVVLSGGIAQDNLFGTGKSASLRLANSKSSKTAALSFTDPYFTPDGVSLGYDVFFREYDAKEAEVSNYKTTTYGAGIRMGVPVTEYDRVNFGFTPEWMDLKLYENPPKRYQDFVEKYSGEGKTSANFLTLKGNVGWGRNKTDSALWPTRGYIMKANAEVGLPGGDIQYYKLTHGQTWFFPLSKNLTLMLNGEVGYADGYGKTNELPFFHNFYGGGLGSVRGYESSSLGPKEINPYDGDTDYLGGQMKAVANAELLFPLPGIKDQRSVRLSLFADAGSVWDDDNHCVKYVKNNSDYNCTGNYKSSFSEELRYSAGAAFTWLSPMGPLKFSYAYPLNKKDTDKVQRFQFQLGTTF